MENIDLKSIGGLMAAVMFVSAILKHAWAKFPNEAIPLANVVLGVPAYIVLLSGNAWTITNIVTGLLTVAAAIGVHSGLKNTGELMGVINSETPTPPKTPILIGALGIFLTGCKCLLVMALLLFAVGCKSVDPATGQKVYDPVKTEKVRAAIKPLVTEATAGVVRLNPTTRPHFAQAADVVCQMRDARKFDPIVFRQKLMDILNTSNIKVDPLVRTAFNTIIAVVEINYADRLKADLPEDQFVWNLLDVVCDGLRGGIAGPA